MGGDAERRRLYDAFSRQWDLGGGDPPGIFVCPLCRDGYTREAPDGPDPQVSLAHIVPAALGGRVCTLTCTPCNNGNGAGLESDLAAKFRYDDWCRGVGTWDVRMTGEFGDIGAALRLSEDTDGWAVYMNRRRSNPACFAALDEWLQRKAASGEDLRLGFRMGFSNRPGQVGAAVLQSAYLMMFSYFGYEFALADRYEPVRDQVRRPDEAVWPGPILELDPERLAGLPLRREGGVMLVRRPAQCVAVFLRFRPAGGRDRLLGVFLPGLGDDGVPTVEPGDFEGTIVPYNVNRVGTGRGHFARLWRTTRG